MNELNYVELEDGTEYIIVDAINDDNKDYLILVNSNDEKNVLVRRIKIVNGEELLTKLDSEEELNRVLNIFVNSHKDMVS